MIIGDIHSNSKRKYMLRGDLLRGGGGGAGSAQT